MSLIHKTAEEIFHNNIKHKIIAEVMSKSDFVIFEGTIIDIVCNQIFIEELNSTVSMFRYEDIRHLQVLS